MLLLPAPPLGASNSPAISSDDAATTPTQNGEFRAAAAAVDPFALRAAAGDLHGEPFARVKGAFAGEKRPLV